MSGWRLVIVGMIACNGGDAKPDAAVTPDAATRIEVNVTFEDATPAGNIDVVFHDASGIPVLATRTDSAGTATIDQMPDVTMVTVLGFDATAAIPARELRTKLGIEPGDTLYFRLGFGGTTTPPQPFSAQLAVSIPPNPPAGATSYKYDFMCESTSGAITSFTHTMMNDCRRPNSNVIDAVVIARNGTTELGFAVMPGITLAASGPTTVDFPSGWRTDWLQFDAAYTKAPAGATDIRTSFNLDVQGNTYFPFSSQATTVTQGSATSRTYRFANGIATHQTHAFELNYGADDPRATAIYARKLAIGATSDDVDLSAKLLPAVTSTNVSDQTKVRPTINWTQAGTHEMAAGGFASVSWSSGEQGSWGIQFPPDLASTSISVPALPDALAAFRPPTDGSVGASGANVSFVWYSYLPTYAALRQANDVERGDAFEEIAMYFPGF